LTSLLDKMVADGPQILAVDDAQWLDAASARSVAFALRRLEDRPVAVIAAVRTSETGRRGGDFAAIESSVAGIRVNVGPLSVAAIHQMLRQTLGTSFPRPLLVGIHRAAGGNPFYALEIAREIQQVGIPPPGQPLPVPADHRELVLLRLRRCPELPATRYRRSPRCPVLPSAKWTWMHSRPPSGQGSSWCSLAGGWSSPTRCSGPRFMHLCWRRNAGSSTGASPTGPQTRSSGPGIWRWRPSHRTRKRRSNSNAPRRPRLRAARRMRRWSCRNWLAG
jgi:hypothetical protein